MTSGTEKKVFDQAFRLVRSTGWPKCHEGVGGTRQRQGGIGNFADADHIESAQVGRLLQLRQTLKHRGFDSVTPLLGGVEQFGGLTGIGALAALRNGWRR